MGSFLRRARLQFSCFFRSFYSTVECALGEHLFGVQQSLHYAWDGGSCTISMVWVDFAGLRQPFAALSNAVGAAEREYASQRLF
jgi:hypothetical protein